MAPRSVHALGLTNSKPHSSNSARRTGKKAVQQAQITEKAAQAERRRQQAEKRVERVYPAALLQCAEGRPTLDCDSAFYDNLWNETKKVMAHEPIHAEHLNRIEQMLRVFDLNPKYGPCSGLTRLERWKRAEELGEEPPSELAVILNTRQGVLDLRYSIVDQVDDCDTPQSQAFS
ncbi:hypothetical protein MVES1_002506 [Malassezia vespertilionis]|uniref:DNA polymerase delta subunit 4 n=1 Tax=Malassezia vespertilionis TaxID=2020962 RepID=A0A2N1J9X0_9BASI|nr:uncharacterized protein MVES1_002506 [Malassezia vespertilionis]PKI83349.1 hypothetical protein MVES_002365 [Malassezia vespertilionis]WFD07148.1 hypothetical protein MVES1_002506 [Malassezia vespertilionis]